MREDARRHLKTPASGWHAGTGIGEGEREREGDGGKVQGDTHVKPKWEMGYGKHGSAEANKVTSPAPTGRYRWLRVTTLRLGLPDSIGPAI